MDPQRISKQARFQTPASPTGPPTIVPYGASPPRPPGSQSQVNPDSVTIGQIVNREIDGERLARKFLPHYLDVSAIPESERESFLSCKTFIAAISAKVNRTPGPKVSFSSRDPNDDRRTFSNLKSAPHYRKIRFWDNDFAAVENVLGWGRALLLKNPVLASKLKLSRNPGQISGQSRSLREKIPPVLYVLLSGELLARANLAKFQQIHSFRHALINTAGELVETDTGTNVWNCGLSSNDPRMNDESMWPSGCFNLAGLIVTYVKEQLTPAPQPLERTHSLDARARSRADSNISDSSTRSDRSRAIKRRGDNLLERVSSRMRTDQGKSAAV